MRRPALALALIGLFALPAAAQTPADLDTGRYVLKETPDGFLRMDSRTGAMSLCAKSNGAFTCRAIADDRPALDAEIKRLSDENAALKAQKSTPILPSDQDMDRALGFMDKLMRRFRDMMREDPPQKAL